MPSHQLLKMGKVQEAVSFPFLGYLLARQGKSKQYDVVVRYLELAHQSGERMILAAALQNYAYWLACNDRLNEAQEFAEEADRLFKQIGAGSTNSTIAEIAWSKGEYEKARSIYMEMQERYSVSGEKRKRAQSLESLCFLSLDAGNLDNAKIYLEEALELFQETGHQFLLFRCLVALSNLFYLQGNLVEFRRKFKECISLRETMDEHHKTYILMTILGSLYLQQPECSARLLGVINTSSKEDYFYFMPMEKQYCNRAEAHIRNTLGDVAYKSHFTGGQGMSLDEALDLTLKTVEKME